ncbi:hypothetical protein V6N11_028655 [Hibiscus sabdariffa]|uniref:Uncharacterized protein n=1 Tax=Hibiscus sabdariffa TaxID=183260 RepID=A0ABR2PR95_9ROSI
MIPFFPIHHVPNQDTAPSVLVHPVPGQDNAPSVPINPVPNQDSAQRSRKRQSRSALSVQSLVNWVVSENQGPNGRFDKYYTHKELKFVCCLKMEVSRYETFGIHPHHPKKTKFNQEQTQTLEYLLALPWEEKVFDQEVKVFLNESLINMHKVDP